MLCKSLEPAQLVIELWTRRGIAIRKIKACDEHAVDLPFEIPAMQIVRVARQFVANLDRIGAAREDRDTIEALLAAPDNTISCLANRSFGKLVVQNLQFLQAGNVGPGLGEPAQQVRQTGRDTIYVEGRDFQASRPRSSHD